MVFLFQLQQARAIVQGGGGVVDGAGSDYDEEAVEGVAVLDYGDGRITGCEDGGSGGCGLGDFVLEEVGRCEGIVAADWRLSVLC